MTCQRKEVTFTNSFKNAILKWKFKKITVVYTIAAVAATVLCAIAIAIVFREVFAFAWQCGKVREAMEEGNRQKLIGEVEELADADGVVDILFLDSENNVTYTAKNSAFAEEHFTLIRCHSQREYYLSATDSRIVFMPVEHGEIVFSLIFSNTFSSDDHDKYEGSSNKTVDLLIHLGETDDESRILIISAGEEVTGGKLTLYAIIVIILLFFLVNQVLLALWAYQNALKKNLSPLFWGILVLCTGTIGALIYILYKRRYRHKK